MIEINFNNKTIRGSATVRDIKKYGLVEASIGEQNDTI